MSEIRCRQSMRIHLRNNHAKFHLDPLGFIDGRPQQEETRTRWDRDMGPYWSKKCRKETKRPEMAVEWSDRFTETTRQRVPRRTCGVEKARLDYRNYPSCGTDIYTISCAAACRGSDRSVWPKGIRPDRVVFLCYYANGQTDGRREKLYTLARSATWVINQYVTASRVDL